MAAMWCLDCGNQEPIAYVDEDIGGRTPDWGRHGNRPSSDLDAEHMLFCCAADGGTIITNQPYSADDTARTTPPLLRPHHPTAAAAW